MALDLSTDCTFTGPALPEPFVKFNLEAELNRLSLLPKATGSEAHALNEHWKFVRRKLGALVSHGGGLRVQNHVIEPLLAQLGYAHIEAVEAVQTREGDEEGGALLLTENGAAKLRVWCVDLDADLDAPARRGLAYRFSHARIAQRVLLATGERLGILTNGLELRLIISDPARVDSQVAISIDPHWKRSRELPDSVRLLIALTSPAGVKALPELIDKARLQQAKVTKDLREQARHAIREFIQELLDHPENKPILAELAGQGAENTRAPNASPSPPSEGGEGRGEVGATSAFSLQPSALAHDLWHEGLITVYRLLFILKLESTDDPARSFSFASTSLWRNTFSPTVALAPIVRRVLDHGAQTGRLLQDGLRGLFRMLSDGLQCTELNVRPMAGALFSPALTPILGRLHWTETAVAKLLNNLLWTLSGRGVTARERVHYGPLDVEDLGRVYEALLELEPGITAETMCRLRRAKLEVVVPAAQGERYRPAVSPSPPSEGGEGRGEVGGPSHSSHSSQPDEDPDELDEEEESSRGKKTKVEWIEEIPAGRFYLRVGLGRKATGSFYTPHSFVRFLVHETLGPLVQRVSPADDPQPCAILKLKVIDKAMGSGHFLVESCRFLGEALYDAARGCDELAASAQKMAEAYEKSGHNEQAAENSRRVEALHQRVIDLPDPDDELLRYLPSRSVEGTAGGVSHNKALALCRRMVAVHCLYGVDKNPLAVELAKLALWIECHAEGLPLTFLDHRLVVGDSLTGPFFEHLLKYPGAQQPLDDLFTRGLTAKLTAALADALQHVRALEATVGVTVADIEAKQAAKTRLDRALAPFKILAAAWSGGVMLGTEGCDDTAYAALAKLIGDTGTLSDDWLSAGGNRLSVTLLNMVAKGLGLPTLPADCADIQSLIARLSANAIPALSFDLAFPEVFYPDANPGNRVGFDADLGNPPWDAILFKTKEFLAAFDFAIMDAPTKKERERIEKLILADAETKRLFEQYKEAFEELKRANDYLYTFQKVQIDGDLAGRQLDAFRVFMERSHQVLRSGGVTGVVVPSAFHSNEGAAGVRQLYLRLMSLRCCYSFENKRKLFEIHSSFKFATVVAEKGTATNEFPCAFYLHDDKWLFTENRNPEALTYTREFISKTGGEHLAFVELRTSADLDVCNKLFEQSVSFAQYTSRAKMQFQTQPVTLHMTKESHRFVPTAEIASDLGDVRQPEGRAALIGRAAFYLSEGKTFHQFDELWGESPRYCVPISKMAGNPLWVKSGRHYRLCFRSIASSTNERTSIFCLLSPGTLSGNSIAAEREPEKTPRSEALVLAAFCNAHAFDWVLRVMTSANVNLFIMNNTPVAITPAIKPFLAHNALRLTCTHAGYAPLWREQLGEAWREAGTAFTWPVLSGEDARWAVRAAIDAVEAHAYGLSRDQYAHVLSTFSHSSYKDAPRQCLAAFDDLQSLGLEAFTKRHDPYWDIPLNENLPQPVIDLPIPATPPDAPPAKSHRELFDFQTSVEKSPLAKRSNRKKKLQEPSLAPPAVNPPTMSEGGELEFWQDRPEFSHLCNWWERGAQGVCALIGMGGVGKTTLVRHFVRRLQNGTLKTPCSTESTKRAKSPEPFVFDFYAEASTDRFFHELERWVRARIGVHNHPEDKELSPTPGVNYKRLLDDLSKTGPYLLVLDGLEKAQDDGSHMGTFGLPPDARITDLICRLVSGELRNVAAIITSRVPLNAILVNAKTRVAYTQISVEGLSLPSGIQLLRQHGIRGTEEQLRSLVMQCAGHPLALNILSGHVKRFYGGQAPHGESALVWPGVERERHPRDEKSPAEPALSEPIALLNSRVARKLDLGDTDQAIGYLQEALSLAESRGDHRLAAAALSNLGEVYRRRGETSTAMNYLEGALVASRRGGDRQVEPAVLNNLSSLHREAGRIEQALALLEQALHLSRELGDRRSSASVLNNLATLYRETGRHAQAQQLFQESLAINRELGDRSAIANVLNNLSAVCQSAGDFEPAITYLREALNLRREASDRRGTAKTLLNLAFAQLRTGRIDDALRTVSEANLIAQQAGDQPLIDALNKLAREIDPSGSTSWQSLTSGVRAEAKVHEKT